ncbi:Fasciclin domain-containing protein [Sulfidibacter corallicola]
MWKSSAFCTALGLLALSFSSHVRAQDDIVDTAAAAGDFTTLLQAAEAAGLVDALRGDGPLTVFAPTDDAFAALPDGTLDALLADTDALANVLLYHVVSGQVLAADVVTLDTVEMLNGDTVTITANDDGVKINDANVVATDILASNGVIHVIDAVLIPPTQTQDDIVDTAAAAGDFTTLLQAAEAAGLVDALRGDGPLTVFAPTDDAFAALPAGTLDALLADPEALADILLYHVVSGQVLAADVVSLDTVEMLNGDTATITANDDGVKINDANVVATDILASNGVIHVIDGVLIPPEDPGSDLPGTQYRVTITNLTRGQVFSPPIAVVHADDISLFQLGQPASGTLRTMAEDGNAQPLADELAPLDLVYDVQVASDPLPPGQSVMIRVTAAGRYNYISVAGMLVSTNDAFFAAEIRRPASFDNYVKQAGDHRAMAHALAYDAGTEANSESCDFIPGPPCGSGGAPDPGGAEGYVYVSNGIHGIGGLDRATYDWRGPVALVTVERMD